MTDQSGKIKVYIISESSFGEISSLGAFFSEVTYEKDGIQYTEMVENEDFIIINEEND